MKKKFLTIMSIAIALMLTLSGCGFRSIINLAKSAAEAVKGHDDSDDDDDDNVNGNNNSGNQGIVQYPDPNSPQGFGDEIVQNEDGVLEVGPNVLDDGTLFYVTHDYTDITYDQALEIVDNSQNYKILGAYAYPNIKRKCSETANYDYFSNKSIEYGLYDQYINGYNSSSYDSVLPVYVSCFNGYNEEFASSISEFTGTAYYTYDFNPFLNADKHTKQIVYDELVAEFGEELAEEYYANYLQVLSSNYIEFVYLTVDNVTGLVTGTAIYGGMYFLELDDEGEGRLIVADVMIDTDTYEMSIQNPDHWLMYDIVMSDDNNGYTLYYNDFSMNYSKTTDNYLIGYVGEDSQAFHDIVSIQFCDADNYYYPECGAAYISDYSCLTNAMNNPRIILRDGSSAVDPVVEFLDGNKVIITFEYIQSTDLEIIPYSVEYTVEYYLIGFMHNRNFGFVLVEDEIPYYFMFDSYDSYGDYLEGDPEHAPSPDGSDDPDSQGDTDIDIIFGDSDVVIELIGKCD